MGNLSTQPQESQGSGWATSRASLGNCLWVPESPRGLSLVGRMVWAQREGTGEAAVGPGNTRSAKAVRDPNTTLMPASAGQTWGRLCGEPTFFPWGPPGEKAGADWSTAPQRRRKRQRRPRHVCADRRGWGRRGRGADCPEPVEAGGGHAVREGAGTWVRKGQGPGVPAAERRWVPLGSGPGSGLEETGLGLDSGRDRGAGSRFMETRATMQAKGGRRGLPGGLGNEPEGV